MAKRPAPKLKSDPGWFAYNTSKLAPLKGLVITLTVIGGGFLAIWSGLVKVGWDPVVSGDLANYKAEVARRMTEGDDALRREFKIQMDQLTLDLRKDLTPLQQEATSLRRELRRFQTENLEAQEAQIIWQQQPAQTNQLAGIERQLEERKGDTFLLGRRAEVLNTIKNTEERLSSIRARLKALREQP